ncbi:MAG: membrane dipeptidase [Dongiaceae bacterium]
MPHEKSANASTYCGINNRLQEAAKSRQTGGLTGTVVIDALQYSNWNRRRFEEQRRGGVDAVPVTLVYWENARETLGIIGRWHDTFRRFSDLILPVRRAEDILEARRTGRTGIIFGFQNCSPIEDDVGPVQVFHDLGVRIMQLNYNNLSLIGAGCHETEDPGISRFGRNVIREMNRAGMIVDLSHSAERTSLQAIELSRRPVVISHANPLWFRKGVRNKSDDLLKSLAASGGMLGLSLYPLHLKDGSGCTLEAFCDMPALAAGLRQRGFAPAEVAGIMGGNWFRFRSHGFGPGS